MAMNAYEAYKMESNCKKVIVEAPGHAVGTECTQASAWKQRE